MRSQAQVKSWRAIEALRAGVPNRDAVQALGSSQTAIEGRFRKQLATVKEGFSQGIPAAGTLVAGDFGSGKSHLLEYLQHIALENNFVCSKVVISKETPLYDPAKVFTAAIESATVQDRAGAALEAVASRLDFNSPEYAAFDKWVNSPDNGLSTRFGATAFVFNGGKGFRDPQVSDKIIQFWSGSPIAVRDLRDWLRELGETATYKIDKVSVKELALQRYQFVPRLMVAAGYTGWVVLIDEAELIGRYSIWQRAKSYAELARWMGKLEGYTIPGLEAVLAITSAFEGEVLDERNDEENIPGRLRAKGGDADLLLATQAERGMRTIRRDKLLLDSPTEAAIRQIYDKVSAIYEKAYDWGPPMDYRAPDRAARIRQNIKRWITEWDLKRLYPDHNQVIEDEELGQDLSEMSGLEAPMEDSPGEGGANP